MLVMGTSFGNYKVLSVISRLQVVFYKNRGALCHTFVFYDSQQLIELFKIDTSFDIVETLA